MKSYFMVPIVVFFALVATVIVLGGGSLNFFVSYVCLAITLGFTFVLLCTHYSPVEMARAFRTGMESYTHCSEKELHDALNFFKTMQSLFILNGILGTLYACVSILTSLGDASQIGVGFAAAIMTIIYSVMLISMISLPFQSAIKKKMHKG